MAPKPKKIQWWIGLFPPIPTDGNGGPEPYLHTYEYEKQSVGANVVPSQRVWPVDEFGHIYDSVRINRARHYATPTYQVHKSPSVYPYQFVLFPGPVLSWAHSAPLKKVIRIRCIGFLKSL